MVYRKKKTSQPIFRSCFKLPRVNFKKFEKKALPNFDHLLNSSAYKMVHQKVPGPKKGIPVRPSKVNAADDIIERIVSCTLGDFMMQLNSYSWT